MKKMGPATAPVAGRGGVRGSGDRGASWQLAKWKQADLETDDGSATTLAERGGRRRAGEGVGVGHGAPRNLNNNEKDTSFPPTAARRGRETSRAGWAGPTPRAGGGSGEEQKRARAVLNWDLLDPGLEKRKK